MQHDAQDDDVEWQDVDDDDSSSDEEVLVDSPATEILKIMPITRCLTWKRLFQHWAVATVQKRKDITLFLRLFKHYKPKLNYNSLPSTAATLLKVKKKKQPSTVKFKGGKYIHFGLENGLAGDSPGLVFENSDLLQFVSVYQTRPELVPRAIRKRVGIYFSIILNVSI